MKQVITATIVGLLAMASAASAQTTVFSHDFETATPGDLSATGTLGEPSVGEIAAPGGFVSATRPAYTSGTNSTFNSITAGAGTLNDVGTPAGNFLTVNLSEPAAVTGVLGSGQTTTIDFNLASFGTNNSTIFKYVHIIASSSAGSEVFHILWRAGSTTNTRQVFARELGQDNTTFMVADPPVLRDGNLIDYDFESVDGTLLATAFNFGLNSTNSASAPSGQLEVSVTIDENGWNATAGPNATGGNSIQTPATGLGIASGATDLASIVFFSSHNVLTDASNIGFWVDNVVVATDLTVSGSDPLLGDVNLDGFVNFLDISPFIALLSGGTFQAEADINESGKVDFLDISPFISILSGS